MNSLEEISQNFEEISMKSLENNGKKDGEETFEASSGDFGDDDCGEPMTAQRIVLDFTPIDGLDTDEVQLKCCAFWDFVKSHPELNDLMVKPHVDSSDKAVKFQSTLNSVTETISMSFVEKEKNAISTLELIETKDIVRSAFETKLPSSCDESIRDYINEPTAIHISSIDAKIENNTSRKGKEKKEKRKFSIKTKIMCESLAKWDIKHPKSLSPPGPVSSLIDTISEQL